MSKPGCHCEAERRISPWYRSLSPTYSAFRCWPVERAFLLETRCRVRLRAEGNTAEPGDVHIGTITGPPNGKIRTNQATPRVCLLHPSPSPAFTAASVQSKCNLLHIHLCFVEQPIAIDARRPGLHRLMTQTRTTWLMRPLSAGLPIHNTHRILTMFHDDYAANDLSSTSFRRLGQYSTCPRRTPK